MLTTITTTTEEGMTMARLLVPTYDVTETHTVINRFIRKFTGAYDIAPLTIGDAYPDGDGLVVPVDSNDATISLLADVLDIDIDD